MTYNNDRTDLPVVLLYNLDRAWPQLEIDEAIDDVLCLKTAMQALGHPVVPVKIDGQDLLTPLLPYDPSLYTVLNWCEGLPGIPRSYDLVAQTLESLGLAYTGSPPEVLALSEDKREVKRLLVSQGVPTPEWRIFESAQVDGWDRFPAIVKPTLEHCSVGISSESVVTSSLELSRRIAYVLETFREPALVEDFVDGREFHGILLGDLEVEMLPPAEIDYSAFPDVHDRLCTYDTKSNPDSAQFQNFSMLLPAPLGKEEHELLEWTVLAAYRAVGCRDYARIDLRLRDGVFYVLDVNANCYMSADCSVVLSAELAGLSYGALGSRLVNLARRRKLRELSEAAVLEGS